jgi:tetratricopeptide (TPR) repeat protein
MVVVAIAILAAPSPAGAQTTASADALDRWVAAVRTHVPGQPDAAARFVAELGYKDRLQLNPAMEAFVKALRGERPAAGSVPQRRIAALFHAVETQPGRGGFVRRAAVLHSDAAIFADRFAPPPDDAPPPVRLKSGRRMEPTAPLLSNERYAMHTDGRVIGDEPANWNWPFARSLVDLFFPPGPRPDPGMATDADRRFAGEWYHAVAAYLMAAGDHGNLRGHLRRAAELLPGDARMVFDEACFAETLGLPYNQSLRDDPAFWSASTRFGVDLPSEEQTDSAAERLFHRALEIEPSYVEARVRMARLLDRRGQHDEAAAHIANALEANPSGVVAYYAHIVAGRLAMERRRYDEALEQYRRASALFQTAQSALLGASQAALMAADGSEALAPIARLPGGPAHDNSDPWWDYQLGAGRDVNDLMARLWSHVEKTPPS